MAFLKDLLVMGPARFIEDIYGTIEFANKLKTGFKINGSDLIYGNEGANNITTPTWGNPVNITIASSDGTNSATAATNINGSAGFTLRLPATIKATLSGNASTATKLSTSTTLKIGNTSKSFDGSETSAIEWTHTQIGASVSNTLTPSGEAIGLTTTVNGIAADIVSISGASTTQAGLVTTGTQNFKGAKSFTNGHLYLKGGTSSSASNLTQIVFVDKDSGTEHIALSSNNDTFCINPSSSSTSGQIVLYLNQASSFPKGITIGSDSYFTGNLSGTASNATQAGKLSHNVTIGLSGDITGSVTTNFSENTSYTISTSLSANYAGSSSKGGAATSALKLVNSSGTAYSVGNATTPVYFSGGIPVVCSGTLSLNAVSATKLATARTIFGRSFDGSANVEGEATVYGTYTATASTRYASGGLEVREAGMVGSAQSDIGYAPTIGFHWGGRVAASLLFHNDGIFYFKQQNGTSRSTIDANLISNTVTATGNITSSADIIGNYLCTNAASEESSTSTSIAVIASNGYLRKLSMPSGANYDSGSNIWSKLVGVGLQYLSTGSSQPQGGDYFISQYAGGGTTHPEFYRRPVSALWSYMNTQAATVYAKLQSPNNMIHNSNEICWVPDSYNNYIWINYRSVGGTGKSTVTGYKFGNANGKTENVFVEANTFSLLQNANMTYNSTDKCIEFTFA